MAKSKLIQVNKKIADVLTDTYKSIEEGTVGAYKKIENGAVSGFNKIADGFVDQYLTKDGESVEEARTRLREEQQERDKARQQKLAEHRASHDHHKK